MGNKKGGKKKNKSIEKAPVRRPIFKPINTTRLILGLAGIGSAFAIGILTDLQTDCTMAEQQIAIEKRENPSADVRYIGPGVERCNLGGAGGSSSGSWGGIP